MAAVAAAMTTVFGGGASALDVKLEEVASGLQHPLLLVSPPGDKRRFITEQIGRIRILHPDGTLQPEPFLNIQEKIIGLVPEFDERGLLGLAFHPNFKSNGLFYASYSGPIQGSAGLGDKLFFSHTNYVAEFRVSKGDPNKADPGYARVISAINWPLFNHNGHWLGFGPDGMLYVSTGDGGYANDYGAGHNPVTGNGQDKASKLGKMLRIDVNAENGYAVPKDNPFANDDEAAPEIWAMGFRNPWRCSFDMGGNNALICGDVGQNSWEEVDVVTKGGNYGWRVREGRHCFDYQNPNDAPASCNSAGMTDPVLEYRNCGFFNPEPLKGDACKGISITGGYVYRGGHQSWQGKYFFGDWSKNFVFKDGQLFVATMSGNNWTMEDVKVTNMPGWNSYVLSFGQDSDGEVYIMATDITGPVPGGPAGGLDKIYKIVP
ncbi:MAG: PQQ-dependent sugar dehydrogenase [Alphaproteobacteria bacterium]|jgi:glucose/arabinose dehydrogenase|nr:PQQ-dependent sugar dehydrogenase [Alphaproteobacteria bacterium]MDP6815520.1 PQQ-dependent sugar dehydrogenase [Alphaproteobacteria bacterium]